MHLATKLRRRLANEESGFTLIELLVVLVIIGILLAIAVPSYLGFKDRANEKAAKANIRAALPAAEAYYSDNGTYVGMTTAALQSIDSGVSTTVKVTGTPTATSYTICSKVGNKLFQVTGPGADDTDYVVASAC